MTTQEMLDSLMNDPEIRDLITRLDVKEEKNAVQNNYLDATYNEGNNNYSNFNPEHGCNPCPIPTHGCCNPCNNRPRNNFDFGIIIVLLLLFCCCGGGFGGGFGTGFCCC